MSRTQSLPLMVTLLALGLLSWGCLTSTTDKFEYNAVEPLLPAVLSGTAPDTVLVDLEEDDIYEDNQDDIDRIDRIGFEVRAFSNNGSAGSFTVSFRRGMNDPFTAALTGVAIAGNTNATDPHLVRFEETETVVENREQLEAAIRAGQFEMLVQGTAGTDVTIELLTLVVVFTVDI